jgi:hypothetical protein
MSVRAGCGSRRGDLLYCGINYATLSATLTTYFSTRQLTKAGMKNGYETMKHAAKRRRKLGER